MTAEIRKHNTFFLVGAAQQKAIKALSGIELNLDQLAKATDLTQAQTYALLERMEQERLIGHDAGLYHLIDLDYSLMCELAHGDRTLRQLSYEHKGYAEQTLERVLDKLHQQGLVICWHGKYRLTAKGKKEVAE